MKDYSRIDQPEILSRIFHPRREERTAPHSGCVDFDCEVEPEVLIGCRFYLGDKNAPSIVYFHGNGETAGDHDDIGPEYLAHGLNLLVMTYRGYGVSSGSPSVQSLFADSRVLFSKVLSWLSENEFSGPIFVMGRSLGSACAIELASLFGDSLKGCIIESGFAETLPLLKTLGIDTDSVGLREEHGFQNSEKIAGIKMPTMFLHGARDQLIPVTEAEKLQANCGARNKQFWVIPGADHNSMIAVAGRLYFSTIKNFIDTVTGTSTWRSRRKQMKSL